MLYLLLVPALPLLLGVTIWIYWGVAFTLLDFIIRLCRYLDLRELEMQNNEHNPDELVVYPARLIRYTDLHSDEVPGILSIFDPKRNIQLIDRALSSEMREIHANALMMCTLPMTRRKGDIWEEYPEKRRDKK